MTLQITDRVARELDRFVVFTRRELHQRDRDKFTALATELQRLQRALRDERNERRRQHQRAELWKHRCLDQLRNQKEPHAPRQAY